MNLTRIIINSIFTAKKIKYVKRSNNIQCDVCGHTFRAMDIEWQASLYTMPVPCPKCGSRHTMPVSFFGCTDRETFKEMWEMNDTLIDSATRRGI